MQSNGNNTEIYMKHKSWTSTQAIFPYKNIGRFQRHKFACMYLFIYSDDYDDDND